VSERHQWNKGRCYRCSENPQWRGFAWCLECSILGAKEILDGSAIGDWTPHNIEDCVRRYSRFPEFPIELLTQMRKKALQKLQAQQSLQRLKNRRRDIEFSRRKPR